MLVLPRSPKKHFFSLLCVLFGIRGQSLKCLEVKEFAPQLDVAAWHCGGQWSLFNPSNLASIKQLSYSISAILFLKLYFNASTREDWMYLFFNELNLDIWKLFWQAGEKFSYFSPIVRLRRNTVINRRRVWRSQKNNAKLKHCQKQAPWALTKLMYEMFCICNEMHFKVACSGPPGDEGVGRRLWRPLIWGLSSSPVLCTVSTDLQLCSIWTLGLTSSLVLCRIYLI